eukprot:27641-Hanusia_phi.AAC.1
MEGGRKQGGREGGKNLNRSILSSSPRSRTCRRIWRRGGPGLPGPAKSLYPPYLPTPRLQRNVWGPMRCHEEVREGRERGEEEEEEEKRRKSGGKKTLRWMRWEIRCRWVQRDEDETRLRQLEGVGEEGSKTRRGRREDKTNAPALQDDNRTFLLNAQLHPNLLKELRTSPRLLPPVSCSCS